MAQMNENYFESQDSFSLLCGMHSINNILGEPAYNKQQLNDICYQLSDDFINPHKHIFGGDYDANVLIIALQNKDCTIKWHDRRNKLTIRQTFHEELKQLELVGYLINKFQGKNIFHIIFRLSPRHWIAVKKNGDKYRFLDSREGDKEGVDKDEAERSINEMLTQNNEPQQATQVIEVYRIKK